MTCDAFVHCPRCNSTRCLWISNGFEVLKGCTDCGEEFDPESHCQVTLGDVCAELEEELWD